MAKSIWSGVRVTMENAVATAVDIQSSTLADPAVIGSTAHGYADGDWLRFKVVGMNRLNNRLFQVANAAADTYELVGIDSTDFDAFTSGTSQKVTLGVSFDTITSVSASGGEASKVDFTTIHDDIAVEQLGVAAAISYAFENNWIVDDPGLLEMQKQTGKGDKAFLFKFRNGSCMAFVGSVSSTLVPVGSAQDKVTTPSEIAMAGLPTFYKPAA